MRCWWFFAVAALIGLPGCGAQSESCDAVSFPAPPSDARDVIFVGRPCDGSIADGSREKPFSSLNAGIAAAKDGATILVGADADFPEDVVVDRPVRIYAAPPDVEAADANVKIRPTVGPGVLVEEGAGMVELRGLIIERAKGAGVWAKGASVTMDAVVIEDTEPDGDGNFGYGVLASDGGEVDMRRTEVTGARDVGVYVIGSRAALDTVTVSGAAQHGGVRLESALGQVTLKDVTVDGCTEVGILVASSNADIVNATVLNIGRSVDGIGDGIVVLRRKDESGAYKSGAEANIDKSLIGYAGRVGVLFSDGAIGSITESKVSDNGSSSAWSAGIWIQSGAGGDAGVLVTGDAIRNNWFNGIGVTSGAFARITQNQSIVGTMGSYAGIEDKQVYLGQALGLYGGARAEILDNTITANDRDGVFMDNPGAGTVIQGNEVLLNNGFGLIVQRAEAGIPPFAMNNFTDNGLGPTAILGLMEVPFPIIDSDFQTP